MGELRYCNCAECGCLLLGDRHRTWYEAMAELNALPPDIPPPVYCRVNGRPYCVHCATRTPPAGRGAREDDGGPWQQNAVREMEDAPSPPEE